MTDEEMEFVRKVNIDKANNKTGIAIVLIVLSILTYIVPLVFGEFDFGIIFEGISLIFLLIAKMYMSFSNMIVLPTMADKKTWYAISGKYL